MKMHLVSLLTALSSVTALATTPDVTLSAGTTACELRVAGACE